MRPRRRFAAATAQASHTRARHTQRVESASVYFASNGGGETSFRLHSNAPFRKPCAMAPSVDAVTARATRARALHARA
eukprot:3068510-Lingulodinium_polyedra.AAC.1